MQIDRLSLAYRLTTLAALLFLRLLLVMQIYLLYHSHLLFLLPFWFFLDDLSHLWLLFLLLLLGDLFFVPLLQSDIHLSSCLTFRLLLLLVPLLGSAFSLFSRMESAFDLSDLRIPLYLFLVSLKLFRIPAFLLPFFLRILYSITYLLPSCFRIVCINLGLILLHGSILLSIRYCMAVEFYFFLFFLFFPSYLSLLFLGLRFLVLSVLLLLKNYILCYILLSLFSSHLALLSLACLLVCLEFLVTFFSNTFQLAFLSEFYFFTLLTLFSFLSLFLIFFFIFTFLPFY